MKEYLLDCIGARPLTNDLKEGLIIGVTLFAHWHQGERYVGTGGWKLKEVYEEINEVFKDAT